jgi:peptidoglycan hydrolase-like protein with peptidoglycan-binding domain
MRTSLIMGALILAAAIAPAAAQTYQPPSPPLLTYTQPLSPQGVQMVQQHLRDQGAYAGRIDGIWGADSQAALERFQQAHGLQVTGQLNQATIATLGIPPEQLLAAGQPVYTTVSGSPIPGNMLSPRAVHAIQARLHDLNFYNGVPDGIWGAETQQAIERFQQGRGLQASGQLNPATISALGLDPNMLVPYR